jgi:Spy/CpxP family protein refolding chaperone
MKNTLRLIAAAAVLAIAAPVYAQSGAGGGGGMGQMTPEQRIARQKEQLFKDITLDAAQTTKVDAIFAESTKKQQEMMQAGGMEAMRSPEGREKMQKLNTDRNDALKAVLKDDQKKKFEENLAAMPQGGRPRGGL